MSVRCPHGHGPEYAETLLNNYRCLKCETYFDQSGKEVRGGAEWTSRVPETHAEDARRTAAAAKTQRKRK